MKRFSKGVPKGVRKHIRTEKARIRRMFSTEKDRAYNIKELYDYMGVK